VASHRLLFTIEEGKRYTWGDVIVLSDSLPAEAVAGLFQIEREWPANLSDLKEMLDSNRSNFQARGYMDCSITPQMSYDDETGQISVRIELHEGPRYVVREIALDSPGSQLLVENSGDSTLALTSTGHC
jgi:outer membrane protein assembly factor BamA